jgi:serine/threonine-protein kinase PpkA
LSKVTPLPQIQGYELHREIGAGGMARVYLATQISLDRKVALKVMAPMLVADPAFSKRFLREARMLANLTHPNIVAVYEVNAGESSDLHYFAMQHLESGDFSSRIRAGLNEVELVRVLVAIAKALSFAHSRGVVHRDVTPGNILFDSANNPVLTDFGIARSQHSGSRITQTGVSIGTSSYMSPEQARGGDVDARSDLYCLGALTFEALTGHPPYQGIDGFAVAYAHVFEPIPRLPMAVAHWQPFLDKVLAKDPGERFASGEQFTTALGDVPVSAQRKIPTRALSAPGSKDFETLSPGGLLAQQLGEGIKAYEAQKLQGSGIASEANAPHISAQTVALNAVPQKVQAAEKQDQRKAPLQPQSVPPPQARKTDFATPTSSGASKWPWIFAGIAGLGAVVSGAAWWMQNRPANFDPVTVSDAALETPKAVVKLTPPIANDEPAPNPGVTELTDPNADQLLLTQTPLDATDPKPGDFGPPTRGEFVKPYLANAKLLVSKNQCFGARFGAMDAFRQTLVFLPKSPEALAGVAQCSTFLKAQIDAALALTAPDAAQLQPSLDLLTHAQRSNKDFGPASPELKLVLSERERAASYWIEQAKPTEKSWDWAKGEMFYAAAALFEPKDPRIAEGLARLSKLAKPGFQFADSLKSGGKAPAMLILSGGSVTLRDAKGGSKPAKIGENFAIARYETSLGEYQRFVKSNGHRTTARGCKDSEDFALFGDSKERTFTSPGFDQDAKSPVVCVGFNDAQAYTKWLSRETGENYRLLSESEWQFAASKQGGVSCKTGNLGDISYGKQFKERDVLSCDDGFAGTAPVGSFGGAVADLIGNAREWVADCRNDAVTGHPGNEKPWQSGNCKERMVLGSAWISGKKENTAAVRNRFGPDELNNTVGFRVARDVVQRD